MIIVSNRLSLLIFNSIEFYINFVTLHFYKHILLLKFMFNLFFQVLDCVIHQNKQISAIVAACNYKGLVDDKAATFLIKEFVFKLVELKG